jgi:hypothetical protein
MYLFIYLFIFGLLMVYLTTLSVSSDYITLDDRMNNDLEMIWTEAFVT